MQYYCDFLIIALLQETLSTRSKFFCVHNWHFDGVNPVANACISHAPGESLKAYKVYKVYKAYSL